MVTWLHREVSWSSRVGKASIPNSMDQWWATWEFGMIHSAGLEGLYLYCVALGMKDVDRWAPYQNDDSMSLTSQSWGSCWRAAWAHHWHLLFSSGYIRASNLWNYSFGRLKYPTSMERECANVTTCWECTRTAILVVDIISKHQNLCKTQTTLNNELGATHL